MKSPRTSPTTLADMYDLGSDNCHWREGWLGIRNIYATVPPLAEHLRTRRGRWSDDTCPQCNSRLLTNNAGDKWCSHVNCEYGLNDF